MEGQLPPTLNIFRITFQVLILCPSIVIKPEQLFPGVIRVLSIIQEFAYPIEIIPIYPTKLLLGVLIANSVERCLEIISRAVVKSLELSMVLNVLWFIIYLSLCKYRYNILYMQINIPGLMKAQGHNPKGH
jgi:hypothetical protein